MTKTINDPFLPTSSLQENGTERNKVPESGYCKWPTISASRRVGRTGHSAPRGDVPTVPTSFVQGLLEALPCCEKRELLARISGIVPALLVDGSAQVTMDQFSALYRLIVQELDDELPGMFSRAVKGGTLKLLCHCVLESGDLSVALYRLSQFLRMVIDDWEVNVSRRDGRVCVALVSQQPDGEPRIFAQEILLKVIHGVISWLAGQRVPLARVDLDYSRPEHAATYELLYPGPAYFDQARTTLHFEIAALEIPVRQSERTLSDFLNRAPAGWLCDSPGTSMVSCNVREYLEKHLNRPTTLSDVARALHFSVRTLSRRLDAEGANFRTIKDELRRDVAIQRLTKTDIPIALVGAEVGFDDPTTFHRAFKKWTGSTPGAYRTRV